jgi:hypothetical protein
VCSQAVLDRAAFATGYDLGNLARRQNTIEHSQVADPAAQWPNQSTASVDRADPDRSRRGSQSTSGILLRIEPSIQVDARHVCVAATGEMEPLSRR